MKCGSDSSQCLSKQSRNNRDDIQKEQTRVVKYWCMSIAVYSDANVLKKCLLCLLALVKPQLILAWLQSGLTCQCQSDILSRFEVFSDQDWLYSEVEQGADYWFS